MQKGLTWVTVPNITRYPMREQMEIRRPGGRCTLLMVCLCFLGACEEEPPGATSLRLSRQGYSPIAKALLIRTANTSDPGKRSFLVIYDEVSASVKRVATVGNRAISDVAWVPGRTAFVGTDLEAVTLFQEDTSGDGYTQTLIQRPGAAVLPLRCSWSPEGQWLAVNCLASANVVRGTLWLYKFGDKTLRNTNVALDYRTLIWEDESLLYGTRDDAVLTIKLTGEKATVVRTVRALGEITVFYGMFAEQPLYLSYGAIRLGDKTLAFLDRPGAKFRVISTNKIIFVSGAPNDLTAFDAAGNQIARSNPGRLVTFGSVRHPSSVYGLADDSLVCLSVKKGTLKIQTVADLDNIARME